MTAHPATLVGLNGWKGAIAAGYDADLVIFYPEEVHGIAPEFLHHRHKVSPYASRNLLGWVDSTYLRGRKVYDRGEFIGAHRGQMLRRAVA